MDVHLSISAEHDELVEIRLFRMVATEQDFSIPIRAYLNVPNLPNPNERVDKFISVRVIKFIYPSLPCITFYPSTNLRNLCDP